MRLSSLVYFYRLRLRSRWVQELLALVGIAAGVALLFAAQVANTSLNGSVKQLVEATVGRAELQLSARDPHGLDAGMLERVRQIPGVRVASPLLEVRAAAVGPKGRTALTLLGADRSLGQLGGPLLKQWGHAPLPTARIIGLPDPIVDRLGIPLGGSFRMEIGGGSVRARLGASLGKRELGEVVQSPIALAPLIYAQRLSHAQGRISRILIRAEPGQLDAVKSNLESLAGDSLNLRPANFDLQLLKQAAAPTNQSTAMFAAISALVGFLFAFNAMLLTLGDRRLLIAALRTDGYSPFAVLQVVLFDALVLGAAASIIGLVVGDALSRELFSATPGYLSVAFPVGEQRIVEWYSVVISLGAGLAATLLAALMPLRDLLGNPRSEVARTDDERISRRLAILLLYLGLGCLVASLAIRPSSPVPALAAVALLVGALMLALPAIVLAKLELLSRLLGNVKSAVPMISFGELRSMPARSIALAATGALAVFGSVASQGARVDLQAGLDRSTKDVNGIADAWAAASGRTNILGTDPIRTERASSIRKLPGVRSVSEYRSGFLDFDDRRIWVLAQPISSGKQIPPSQIIDGNLALAKRRLQQGGWAVVSDGVAAEHGLGIGDRFTLPAPHPRSFRVAALTTNVGWPPGTVVVNPADYQRGWGSTDPTAFQITFKDGVTPEQGRREVERALGPASSLTVETTSAREARHRAISRQALSRLNQLSVLVLIAAILAMSAAMAGMVWQRRKRLASLKLDGFDNGTVWRALLLESAVLLGTGCLTGALFGLCGQQLLDRALETVTGFPVVSSVDIEFAFLSFALVTAVAVAIAALPGYLAARVPPAVALQD